MVTLIIFIFIFGTVLSQDNLDHSPECLACKEIVKHLQQRIKDNFTSEDMELLKEVSTEVCLIGANKGWWDEDIDRTVCQGLVNEFTLELVYILTQSRLSPSSVCSFLDKCPPIEVASWNVTLNPNKPPIEIPPVYVSTYPRYQILHLSDLHFDPLYVPNRTTDCGEPVCCRFENHPVTNSSGAGKWGDYRYCDTTTWTLESMLNYVSLNFEVDLIIYTGDTVPHTVWSTSPEKNIFIFNVTYQLIRKYLPKAIFFGAIGNHDPSPVNLVPPPGTNVGVESNDIQWMYDSLVNIWGEFLDDSALETLRYAGYYSQRIDDSLVLISLHMNLGDSHNWWLLVNSTDPGGMLQWLSNTLQQCEDNGDHAIIIAHQHPNGLLDDFNWNYFQIVYRYENTISVLRSYSRG